MAERIVVLDGYTTNPGDIDWGPLEALGELVVHDRTRGDQVVSRATDVPLVLTNKTVLSAETIAQLPQMRYIGVLATGTNVVDLPAAARHGIVVTNLPDYSSPSVAQHVFALLLELTNLVADHDQAVHDGQWSACQDFCFTVRPIRELQGKTLGIVGVGAIGQRVARIGSALGMRIAAVDQQQVQVPGDPGEPGVDIEWMELEELFATADVLSLHCPLTEQTQHIINAEHLDMMKPSALLINTGRGPLVDEAALAAALRDQTIAAAAVDVLSTEPPPVDNPLLAAPNCIITPHCAWNSVETRLRLMDIAAANIKAFLTGEPINVVTST